MRTHRAFWSVALASLALSILGYFGFLTFMPGKNPFDRLFPFLICVLMLLTGAAGLLGALIYAVVRTASERKRTKARRL